MVLSFLLCSLHVSLPSFILFPFRFPLVFPSSNSQDVVSNPFVREQTFPFPFLIDVLVCFLRYSMVNGTLLYCAVGPLAYFVHPATTGDILADFETTSHGFSPALLGQLSVSFALLFSFPLLAFEGVHSAHCLLAAASPSLGSRLQTDWGRMTLAGLFTLICGVVAIAAADTGKIIAFVGSAAGIPIMYIFPCWIYLGALKEKETYFRLGDDGGKAEAGGERRDKLGAKFGMALGTVVFVLCTTSSVVAFFGIE